MILSIPTLDVLCQKVNELTETVGVLQSKVTCSQQWFSLKEACRLKGVPYNSVKSRPKLQPNRGKPDGIVSGRKRWTRETILQKWLHQTDRDLLDN